MTTNPLTKPQMNCLRVLADLNDEGPALPGGRLHSAAPRDVARGMWPDSEGWDKRSNRGSTPAGGALGATMPMKAATMLWRLRERGCVMKVGASYDSLASLWQITRLGRRVLAGTDEPLPVKPKPKPETMGGGPKPERKRKA